MTNKVPITAPLYINSFWTIEKCLHRFTAPEFLLLHIPNSSILAIPWKIQNLAPDAGKQLSYRDSQFLSKKGQPGNFMPRTASLFECLACSGWEEYFQNTGVKTGQAFQVIDGTVFIHLVNGLVQQARFYGLH